MMVADEVALIHALRARADELNVSRQEIDRVAGLTPGLASKLLSIPPIRYFGPLTSSVAFWSMIGCLGLAVHLIEDEAAGARFSAQMDKRNGKSVRTRARLLNSRIPWLFTPEMARNLAMLGMLSMTPKQRTKRAKTAAKARWRNRQTARVCPPRPV